MEAGDIIRVTEDILARLGLPYDTPSGRRLVLGTIAVESDLRFLYQMGRGPARGICQMEPATALDIWRNWMEPRWEQNQGQLRKAFLRSTGLDPKHIFASGETVGYYLASSLALDIAMCRLHYYRRPEPLPDDLPGQAAYWKQHYNTPLGAGKPEEYVARWNKHRLGVLLEAA